MYGTNVNCFIEALLYLYYYTIIYYTIILLYILPDYLRHILPVAQLNECTNGTLSMFYLYKLMTKNHFLVISLLNATLSTTADNSADYCRCRSQIHSRGRGYDSFAVREVPVLTKFALRVRTETSCRANWQKMSWAT